MAANRWVWIVALGLALGLGGCGGAGEGSSDGPGAPSQPPSGAETLGADGGKVTAEAAELLIPPRAMSETATIRIATDSAGSPALPGWFRGAGPMLSLTPHGATFAEPVTLRVRAPAVTLADNERLYLAKVQPGGQWEVLTATELKDGYLEVQVRSFSYVRPVVVPFTTATVTGRANPVPFELAPITLECDGRPCVDPERLRTMTVTISTSGNGGQIPASCVDASIELSYTGLSDVNGDRIGELIPVTAALTVRRDWELPSGARGLLGTPPGLRVWARMRCVDPTNNAASFLTLGIAEVHVDAFARNPSAPVVRTFAPQLSAAAGEQIALRAVFSGGASYRHQPVPDTPGGFIAPTPSDQASVFFERLAPGESGWMIIGQALQTLANPSPLPGVMPWMYWSLDQNVGPLTLADSGTRYRVRACYRPPSQHPSVPQSCTIGPVATLTVLPSGVAPAFTQQPASLLIQPGQTASFSALVGGSPTPTLQWQTRAPGATGAWTDVAGGLGATSANYTTVPLTLADNGVQYRLLATNSTGSKASEPVLVSVAVALVAPSITAQPMALAVVAGSEAVFAVGASGTAALSYQWSKDGTPIAGANGAQLKITNASAGDAGSYAVSVSNAAGSVSSNAALLQVNAVPSAAPVAPTIATAPAAVAVTEGNTATFGVGVAGSGPFSFQWRRNGTDVPGATAAALTIAAVSAADAGNYSVVVRNAAGSATSPPATLAVVPAAAGAVAPTIVVPPAGVVVAPGMSAAFGVTVQGSGPMTYRWFRNGVEVPGQTSAVYTIAAASATDIGTYRVEVSNSAGSALTGFSQLVLLGAPSITQQPAPTSAVEGGSATFGVAASGEVLRYQWTRNGSAIVGATAASYTTPALALADNGAAYAVIVYNGAGLLISSPAALTVNPAVIAPTVTLQPSDLTVDEGTPAGIEFSFGGTAPFTTQLERLDGGTWTVIAGPGPLADNAVWRSYTGNLTLADSGSVYRVVASNAAGTATTRAATVTVVPAPIITVQGDRFAAGWRHTCAVLADGNAACWGYNGSGQLGAGNRNSWPTPRNWSLPESASRVAAGSGGSCVLTVSGRLLCSGNVVPGTSTVPVEITSLANVRQVVLGSGHACALLAERTVWCWGNNASHQLGDGTGVSGSTPRQVQRTGGGALTNVAAITAGDSFNCALLTDGTVVCWGQNSTAQTGQAASAATPRATAVAGLAGVTRIAAGEGHACALAAGSVACWGDNSAAQFGIGSTTPAASPTATPTAVPGLSGVTSLASGSRHVCALMGDTTVRCWGTASMGNGSVSEVRLSPVAVAGLGAVVGLSAGLEHTCAQRGNGALVCWGASGEGQLGLGDTFPRTTPTQVPGLTVLAP